MRYGYVGEITKIVLESCLGRTPKIEHDFNNLFEVCKAYKRLPYLEGEDI
jgi:hypothetical protein